MEMKGEIVLKRFMDKDFLLTTKTAKELYRRGAEKTPIFDWHCHLSPKEIYENKRPADIAELWLSGDHYKWRLMRSCGISEDYITGTKPNHEKFKAFASCLPYAVGNPMYHWTHLELQRYFGVEETLSEKTAQDIYRRCNEKIRAGGFTPRELIEKNAIELTIEFRNKDGRRVVAPNGAQSVKDLYANGYKLGIISNLVTSREIPDWLERDHLTEYFGAVLLSCVEGIRKPDPAISAKACNLLGVLPERCVYIGDNLKRDVEGTRLAGFGMFILYTTPEKLAKEKITDENRPDAVIFDFAELREMFPKAPTVNWDKVRRVD